MVFAPQGYWRPTIFSPPYRYYFHIPKDGQKSPTIFFEAQGRLFKPDGSVPEGIPHEIRFPGSVNGELAFVRVSDIPRYDSNFQPPNIMDGLKKDSHTNQIHAYPKETQPTHDSSN